VITLDNVSKTYAMTGGRKIVLQNATAAFASGYNYGVLGANGAGKSTLIRLLAGSEMPDRGRIRRDARVSFPLGFGGTFHGPPRPTRPSPPRNGGLHLPICYTTVVGEGEQIVLRCCLVYARITVFDSNGYYNNSISQAM